MTAQNCIISGCGGKSANFIQCIGNCGRRVHASCAGLSRNAINDAETRILKFICDNCPQYSACRCEELEKELRNQSELIAETLSYVKKVVARMDLRDEHIDDLERSLQQPGNDICSTTLSRLDSKIDQLFVNNRREYIVEPIDMTPLTEKLEQFSRTITDATASASNLITEKLNNIMSLLDKTSRENMTHHYSTEPGRRANANELTISPLAFVDFQPFVVGDEIELHTDKLCEEAASIDTDDTAPSLHDELQLATSIINWDTVNCLSTLFTDFGIHPTLNRNDISLTSLAVAVCDKHVMVEGAGRCMKKNKRTKSRTRRTDRSIQDVSSNTRRVGQPSSSAVNTNRPSSRVNLNAPHASASSPRSDFRANLTRQKMPITPNKNSRSNVSRSNNSQPRNSRPYNSQRNNSRPNNSRPNSSRPNNSCLMSSWTNTTCTRNLPQYQQKPMDKELVRSQEQQQIEKDLLLKILKHLL